MYDGAGDWKQRLSFSADHEDDAYLIVLDGEGIVRWLSRGPFDPFRSEQLHQVLAATAGIPPEASGGSGR
ncbi:hypothetical protein D3C83_231520 [compost metagenome]